MGLYEGEIKFKLLKNLNAFCYSKHKLNNFEMKEWELTINCYLGTADHGCVDSTNPVC